METSQNSKQSVMIGCMKTSKKNLESFALHAGLLLACTLYIAGGAFCFYNLEKGLELEVRQESLVNLEVSRTHLLEELWQLTQNESLPIQLRRNMSNELLDTYMEQLFDVFGDSYASAAFQAKYINPNTSADVWTPETSVLLATTTLIPVGYGFVTARTTTGRVFNVLYAMFGIPMLVVTLGDMSRFVALGMVLVNHKVREVISGEMIPPHLAKLPMTIVLGTTIAYILCGGVLFMLLGVGSLLDSVYFALITIFTIGYGDIHPDISYSIVIGYIILGTVLLTSCIDMVAVVFIDRLHYFGRQAKKAKEMADKMLSMAQNWRAGLGGLSQMAAFGRMGGMVGGAGGGGMQFEQQNGLRIRPTTGNPTRTRMPSEHDMARVAAKMSHGCFTPYDLDDYVLADDSMETSFSAI